MTPGAIRGLLITLCCLPGTLATLFVVLAIANGGEISVSPSIAGKMQPVSRSDDNGYRRHPPDNCVQKSLKCDHSVA